MNNEEVFEQLKNASSLAEALKEHFSFLADTPGFEPVLAAVMDAAVDVQSDYRRLIVVFPNEQTLTCKEPAEDYLYKKYPESIRTILYIHEGFRFPKEKDWTVMSLERNEYFDFSILKKGKDAGLIASSVSPKDSIRCCFTDFADWWIHHPEEKNPQGEPVLCLVSHESGEIVERRRYNIGSLLLARLAEILKLDVEIPQIAEAAQEGAQKGIDPAELGQWFDSLDPLWQGIVKEQLDDEGLPLNMENIAKILEQTDSLFLCNEEELDTLSGIERFVNLRDVTMHRLPIEDFSPLAGLAKLNELKAGGHPGKSYQWLSGLKNIDELVLFDLTPEHDIEAVGTLARLKILSLHGKTLDDISVVSKLKNLKELDVEGTAITSLEPLRDLDNLTTLVCGKTQVSDLTPLHGKGITYLNCGDAKISFESLLAFTESLSDKRLASLSLNCYDYMSPENLLKALKALNTGQTAYPRALAKISYAVFNKNSEGLAKQPKLRAQILSLLKEQLPKENFDVLEKDIEQE